MPSGVADRTISHLHDEDLLAPEGLADRVIERLDHEGLIPAAQRGWHRTRSIFYRPITGSLVRIATAACLILGIGLLSIPEFADRVEPVQKKILGEKVTQAMSKVGDAILDRWI